MPTDFGAVYVARQRSALQQPSEEPIFLLLWIVIALAHVTLALADPVFAQSLAWLGRF